MKFYALFTALCLVSTGHADSSCQAAATRSHACCQRPEICEFPKQTELKTRIANLETEFANTAHITGAMSNLEVQSQKARELRRAIAAAKVEQQDSIAQTCAVLAKECLRTCAKSKATCGQDLALAKSLRDDAQKLKDESGDK